MRIQEPDASSGQPCVGVDDGEAELLKSGTTLARSAPARSGYVPVPLDQILITALRSIPVYLRTNLAGDSQFALYCAANGRFTRDHQRRLHQSGVGFVYIPLSHHRLLQDQVEQELESIAGNPDLASSTKSAIVYETGIELINEVLTEQGVGQRLPRLERVSRAVSTLVMKDAQSFPHLFATSQHDFYTATHMVNVGTWMTSLAYAMGIKSETELEMICTAGMLHDVGKMSVPEEILNKVGRLEDSEWVALKAHPERGVEYLKEQGITNDVVLRVTLEHHERINGTGYPRRLTGEQIHRVSKICAVVDSFDAMTACRPFKNQVKTIAEALAILREEATDRYDAEIVAAWCSLMGAANRELKLNKPQQREKPDVDRPLSEVGRRAHERFGIDCPLVFQMLTRTKTGWDPGAEVSGKSDNISRKGLGFLSPQPVEGGSYVRVRLKGKGTLSDLVLEGQVMHCRGYGDGWHEVGIKLCRPGQQEAASTKIAAAA